MKSVGETLKNKRLLRNLVLEEVEKATKIKKEFLSAIEDNQFSKIPTEVAIKGFIKNYAEFLGLSSKEVLAIFRRDNSFAKKAKTIHQNLFNPLNKARINWNPKLTLVAVVIVFLLGLFVYLGYQYLVLVQSPHLGITTPKDEQKVTEPNINIEGKSDSDSIVRINDNLVLLSAKGEFSYELLLFRGENKIIIEAVSKFGKKSTKELTVFRLDKNP